MSQRMRRRAARRKKPGTNPILNPPPPTRPFWREAVHAFVYPLGIRGLGATVLLGFMLTVWSFGWLSTEVLLADVRFMLIGMMIAAATIYLFFEVIQTSAGGARRFPFMLFGGGYDPFEALIYGIEGVVVSYLPAIGTLLWTAGSVGTGTIALVGAFGVLGCLYLPPALLSLAIWRDMAAVSPDVVLPLWQRTRRPMMLATLVLSIALVLHVMVMRAAIADGPFDLVFFGHASAIYLFFVAARIIGITHWVYRNRIGWFPDRDAATMEE